jgi:pullulanase
MNTMTSAQKRENKAGVSVLRRIGLALLLCSTELLSFSGCNQKPTMIISAKISAPDVIDVQLQDSTAAVKAADFYFTPAVQIYRLEYHEGAVRLHTAPLDLTKTWYLHYQESKHELQPDDVLNSYYSGKPMGCTWDGAVTCFRLFSPRAKRVNLNLYATAAANSGERHELVRDKDGVWELSLPGRYFGQAYTYQVDGPAGATEQFDFDKEICDPYSRAVATVNEHLHRGRTLIIDTGSYDWQGDRPLGIELQEMVIYECHIRDLTAHPSSGCPAELAGSYKGLIQPGLAGGIDYIKALGVNAIELLPIHEFGNIEPPYNVDTGGTNNTWNPYSRNHWGYMSSYFFAPEAYYASGAEMTPGAITGAEGRQIGEFKELVKTFHQAGIAVILDVVYNHVSQYDQNCFKLADKKYYFRLDEDQDYIAASGCGNDFKTERPMAQRLILESVKYWMEEFHVDGFRFDLAAMIDWETVDLITREARKINPHVVLIAEPWGGGKYDPAGFSKHDWAAWNDQFRNGIKGQNPENGRGFIFGRYWGDLNREAIKRFIRGTLAVEGGLFQKRSHAVNYLGSHDDHSFGDFVRIGSGATLPDQTVQDPLSNARLTTEQLKINKLGALILFTSQGAVMMEEGHEFARSKVIAKTAAPDKQVGRIDHNSYNKDNETNWLNYGHAELNRELIDYYKGLISLRRKYGAFRNSTPADIHFSDGDNPFALSFQIPYDRNRDIADLLVLLNGHREEIAKFNLPKGRWRILVNGDVAGAEPQERQVEGELILPATTGMVLIK